MSGLHHIIAIVLLAIWLPTTQHCGLEAAGLIHAATQHTLDNACCDSTNGEGCTHAACNVAEKSLIKSTSDTLKAPAPTLASWTCFVFSQLVPQVIAIDSIPNRAVSESPENWIPVWQFERRTALRARAPDFAA